MDNFIIKIFKQAKGYINNRKRLKKLISKASDKSLKLKDKEKRQEFKDDVNSSILLLKDWSTNEYTEIPKKSILSIIAAMLYFVIPTDLIPDFILGTGFLDDAAVLSFLFASIKDDIEKYKIFKLNKNQKKSTLEKTFIGYENLAIEFKRNDRYLLEILLNYFSKYEFGKKSLEKYFSTKVEDFYIRNHSALKRKNSLNYIVIFITAYTVFNNKNAEERQNDIIEIMSLFIDDQRANELKDILFIYSNIVSKIIENEKDKSIIFFEHDFKSISFKNEANFDLGSGRFLKEKEDDVLVYSDNTLSTLKQICYLIYNSNSYFELSATIKEYPKLSLNSKTLSLFLGAIYFDSEVTEKNTYISKILNLNI